MTAHCTNPELGRLLHAYEMGWLDSPDLESFERHLLNCDACFQSLQEWEPRATLLRDDSDFARAAETLAREHGRRLKPSIRELLWPRENPVFLRPGAIYFAALILVIALLILRPSESGNGVFETQIIYLAASRDSNIPVYAVNPGDPLVVSFHVDGHHSDRSYVVKLTLDSTEIFSEPGLKQLDKLGTGSLVLAPGIVQPGLYQLLLLPVDSDSSRVGDTLSFMFRTELLRP